LKKWVANGENAAACESALVMHRRSLQREQGNEECLTLAQMFEAKIPVEKIRAVVSRGGGIPDKDAPGIPKLTRYWIETSRTRTNREEMEQTAELRVRGNVSGAIGALGTGFGGPAANQQLGDVDALLKDAQAASAPPAGGEGIGFQNSCYFTFQKGLVVDIIYMFS